MIRMLECLLLSWRFLSLSSVFSILVSSFCSGWMFFSPFCSTLLIWVPVSSPSLLVPCIVCFISLCIAFTFPSILWPFLWASWLPAFWILHLIGWLCLHRLVLVLEFWSVLSFGPYFFVWACLLYSKEQSLRYSPGQGNPCCCVVALYERGVGSQREQCYLLGSWLSLSNFPHYL